MQNQPLNPDKCKRLIIGRNIRLRREFQGWTQRELGSRLGCSEEVISRVEQGKTSFRLEMGERVKNVFGMRSTDELFKENPFQ